MNSLYVAGVGASGGGLPALFEFFGQLPKETGIAYVVLTHIKRDHRSRLTGLIAKHTEIPVVPVEHNVVLEPDRIYVLPENIFVTVKNGILQVRQRRENEIINRAVDIFFESLAVDFREKSIGIVLSGAGEDGLSGARSIEAQGGIVMAQDPERSNVRGMPDAIVERDTPSVIAAPALLALQLLEHVQGKSGL